LPGPRFPTQIEESSLCSDGVRCLRFAVAASFDQCLRNHDLIGIVTLRPEAGLAREQLVYALGDNCSVGQRLRLVKAN